MFLAMKIHKEIGRKRKKPILLNLLKGRENEGICTIQRRTFSRFAPPHFFLVGPHYKRSRCEGLVHSTDCIKDGTQTRASGPLKQVVELLSNPHVKSKCKLILSYPFLAFILFPRHPYFVLGFKALLSFESHEKASLSLVVEVRCRSCES